MSVHDFFFFFFSGQDDFDCFFFCFVSTLCELLMKLSCSFSFFFFFQLLVQIFFLAKQNKKSVTWSIVCQRKKLTYK
jgi:hypothetical protein